MVKFDFSSEKRGAEPQGRVYVAENLEHLTEAKKGMRTWWCVSPQSKPGSIGFLYQKKLGFQLAFRVIRVRPVPQSLCVSFGMATADIEVLVALKAPIAIKVIRQSGVLARSIAVRRNFQFRMFPVEPVTFPVLLKLFGLKAEKMVLEAES